MPSTPRAYPPALPNQAPPRRPSMASSASQAQAQTPPSRTQSQVSVPQESKDIAQAVPTTNGSVEEVIADSAPEAVVVAEPFVAPLPWLSVADSDFPPRATRGKRSILKSIFQEPLYFPPETAPVGVSQVSDSLVTATDVSVTIAQSVGEVPVQTPTTLLSETQSEHVSTQPTTPSSAINALNASQETSTQQKASRVTMPVMPIVPAMPTSPVATRQAHRDSTTSAASKTEIEAIASDSVPVEPAVETTPAPLPAPKSWADLVRKQSAAATANAATVLPVVNGLAAPRNETVGEVLSDFNVADAPSKVAFLRPRGLVNTGNMCYMNSVSPLTIATKAANLTWSRFFNFLFFAYHFMTFWTK